MCDGIPGMHGPSYKKTWPIIWGPQLGVVVPQHFPTLRGPLNTITIGAGCTRTQAVQNTSTNCQPDFQKAQL